MLNRRSLITGLISLVAAPAIVRAGSLMPVKALPLVEESFEFSGFYSLIPMLDLADVKFFQEIRCSIFYMADGSTQILEHWV